MKEELSERKGIIFDIKRYAIHDGPGIRTTIFFQGCPLACQWCQNPESQSKYPEKVITRTRKNNLMAFKPEAGVMGVSVTVSELMSEVIKDIPFFEESRGGVTFSGGEPFMQPEFLKALLVNCKNRGIPTVVDTSGYVKRSILKELAPLVDLFLYDLKLMDNSTHKKFTGHGNQVILDNLIFLLESNFRLRVRVALIPGITAEMDNLRAIIEFLKSQSTIPEVDLLPFNYLCKQKYDDLGREFPSFPGNADSFEKYLSLFRDSGIKAKIEV